jgi:phosphonate transport system substrate-binding protein
MTILRSVFLSVCVLLPLLFSSAGTVYAKEPLLFGVHPYMLDRILHKRFAPLASYLSQKTGQPIKVVITRDYEEQINKMGKGELDFAFMGPSGYVKMVDRYGEKTLLGCLEAFGKSTFHGVIIIARDSPIRSLAELRGKRFAFGDPNSTMSHLVPKYMLRKAGITVDKLGSHSFLGRHENVALGVLSGDFDAGAVKEEVFLKYEKRGLKILVNTPEFSEHVIVASNKLPKKAVQVLRKALLDLKNDNEGRAILNKIKNGATGIVPANDNAYDNLRKVLRSLKKIGTK